MRDPFAAGRRLAQRVLIAQAGATSVVALLLGLYVPSFSIAMAALWGGLSVTLAQAVFAWVQWRGRMVSVRMMTRRFFAGAAWKWVVLFGLFALGLSFKLSPPAMLAGLIVALMAGTGALIRYG